LTDPRLKIAVFVDFDNIEIGVKSTLGGQFDIGLILEAIKERGEVVTKVAYGDWKRAGDHGRLLSQHAIRMVQRNLTPGGDKNGADINLALDALEMAFTHAHINAFVIVGGDSDFITLVEKLKQYDRKVFVVGGRQFTSLVMQRNCHEFIAYENLLGTRRSTSPGAGGGRARGGGSTAPAATDIDKAMPLVKRALKVLADREVTPQLGLLKSTLLQLDSTFSERDYGTGTFRDFIEKVAERGLVTLKQAGRSVLVELADTDVSAAVSDAVPAPPVAETAPAEAETRSRPPARQPPPRDEAGPRAEARHETPPEAVPPAGAATAEPSDTATADAAALAARVFARAKQPPRWPMYIRQVRQYLRAADPSFDERKLGFPGIVEFLRACQHEGVLRLERDRQGVLRVFPGPQFAAPAPADDAVTDLPDDSVAEAGLSGIEPEAAMPPLADGDPVSADIVVDDAAVIVDGEVSVRPPAVGESEAAPAPTRSTRKRKTAVARTAKKTTSTRTRRKKTE
jgi:uncharacterized LabA/DUF88 family protein